MSDEAKWYVVHTYSGYENKVASNLEKTVENHSLQNLIFEIRVPTEKVTEVAANGKTKEVERKIFPGYVIVKMILTDESWYAVRNIRGCTGFIIQSTFPPSDNLMELLMMIDAARRASAYKVSFGADAESLISKMPGLEVADGGIEAQGRTVQRVYVDGREFFGNDVMSAVRNIPADMVESIDVYNSQGDQSEFTGVDIGDGYTAINIVTQPDKRRGAFGRLFAGYGIPDKYIGGGNVNIFDRARRLSVIALVNNVNMQNFSSEDILGTTEQGQANARSGSGNFMVRPLDGVSTVQAVGANYSDEWGEKAKITASYFFNRAGNRNESLTDRQTFTSSEKLVLYDGATDARIENVNHRFNSRFDYKFNAIR